MTITEPRAVAGLPRKVRRRTRIGLVAGGLGAYWPQFPDLLPTLQESARYVTQRFTEMDADVVDVRLALGAHLAALAERERHDDRVAAARGDGRDRGAGRERLVIGVRGDHDHASYAEE